MTSSAIFACLTLKWRTICFISMPLLVTIMVVKLGTRHLSISEFHYGFQDGNNTSSQDVYVVPNIVHFIWFKSGSSAMTFFNYMSIRSAYQVHKPDKIMLHCDNLPAGDWWDRLWREVPLTIVRRQFPTHIFGQKINHVFHQGDVAKLEVLLEYGGIYLDYDVYVVNNLNPLRQYPATYGKEKGPKVIAGIIISERNATFIRMVYESYRDNYKGDQWDYNCAVVAYELAMKHTDLVHIEQRSLTTPDWLDRHNLFDNVIDWSNLYVIHAMIHGFPEHWTPESIKTRKGTLGAVLRWLYFGTKDMIFPNATQASTNLTRSLLSTTPSTLVISRTSSKRK